MLYDGKHVRCIEIEENYDGSQLIADIIDDDDITIGTHRSKNIESLTKILQKRIVFEVLDS